MTFDRGSDHAHAERFTQNQPVATARSSVIFDLLGVHLAHDRKTVDRFRQVDGMPSDDQNPRFAADALPPLEDRGDSRSRQFVNRHSDHVESEQWLRPHRIYVGNRVGCCDAPEVPRIIDDGGEEVGCRHQRARLTEREYCGVLSRGIARQQVFRIGTCNDTIKQPGKRRGRDLTAATATVRQCRQPDPLF